MNQYRLATAIICLLAMYASAFGRGLGVETYLISSDGQLLASLGDTKGDLIDPEANVIFRYRDGTVSAAVLDKPDVALWTAPAKPQINYQRPEWRLLPKLIVVIGEDAISGLDRANGKVVYSTTTGNFTRRTNPLLSYSHAELMPEHTIYLIDDLAQHQQTAPGKPDADADQPDRAPQHAATIAQFDLATGKFLWKTPVITPLGHRLLPSHVDARGIVSGRRKGDAFYFDPATGKALAEPPVDAPTTVPTAKPGVGVQTSKDTITFSSPAGKVLWTVKEPAEKGKALVIDKTVLVPLLTVDKPGGSVKAEVLALNVKDGAKRWRYSLPRDRWTDRMDVTVQTAKRGYLVRFFWLVLD